MTDKILKLLNSPVFEDIYIGLKLLDNLSKKDCLRFLRNNFGKGTNTTWKLNFKKTVEIPYEYDGQYIKGKNYHYIIESHTIMVDNQEKVRWTFKNFKHDTHYKIVESWI